MFVVIILIKKFDISCPKKLLYCEFELIFMGYFAFTGSLFHFILWSYVMHCRIQGRSFSIGSSRGG